MAFHSPSELHTEFSAALQQQDLDTLTAMYEDDAVQLQPDGTTVTGASAIRTVLEQLIGNGVSLQGEQRLALVAGDLALTSTVYTLPRGDGGSSTISTAEVSRRQPDGTWRVVIDTPTFTGQFPGQPKA